MHLVRVLLVLSLIPAVSGCAGDSGGGSQRPQVVASFYPLAFVVEEVGGGLVDVENLTPPGAEPHDLELTSGRIRSLAGADLVVYLGHGFQPSVEDAVGEVDVAVLDVLETQQDLLEPSEHEEEEGHEEEEHGHDAPVDPHVWLDPERLRAIAVDVADRLAELDPENAATFRANADELASRLDDLDAEFRDGLSDCQQTTIVTSHEGFGYLADAYGLEEVGVAGVNPEAEPSPRRLAEVAEFVEENGVTTIFFEVLVSPRTAETLAQEAGVKTARLDPLEGPPDNGDYFTAMGSNLDALRQGLGCT